MHWPRGFWASVFIMKQEREKKWRKNAGDFNRGCKRGSLARHFNSRDEFEVSNVRVTPIGSADEDSFQQFALELTRSMEDGKCCS
jgi:hypothetical protein